MCVVICQWTSSFVDKPSQSMLKCILNFNLLTAKLFNLNFHPLEVVSRWRDPQLQVSENYSDLTKWRSTLVKCCRLMFFELWNNTPAVLHCGVSGWRGGKRLPDLVDQLTLECCHSFRFCGSCRKRIPIRDSSMPKRILSQCGVSSDVFISLIVPTTCSSICWD